VQLPIKARIDPGVSRQSGVLYITSCAGGSKLGVRGEGTSRSSEAADDAHAQIGVDFGRQIQKWNCVIFAQGAKALSSCCAL
jgi:hypothetical protein